MSSLLGRYDYVAKLLIVGDIAVGKTSFLKRFADDTFVDTYTSTIGVDFKYKTVQVNSQTVKVTVVRATQWDTCGQERFRVICRTYYRDAQGVILCFDFTNERSFGNVRNWMQEIRMHAGKDAVVVVVGTKWDVHSKAVTLEQAQSLAGDLGVPFFETSAKDSLNVTEVFTHLAKAIVAQSTQKQARSASIALGRTPRRLRKTRCC